MGGGGAGFPPGEGETLTADETEFWSDQAALLDPDAYVHVQGTSQSVTVAAGERYYVVNAWFVQGWDSGANHWFHRQAHVDQAFMLSEGTTITTSSSESAASMK